MLHHGVTLLCGKLRMALECASSMLLFLLHIIRFSNVGSSEIAMQDFAGILM